MKKISYLSNPNKVSKINSICRACLCPLFTIDELFRGECMDCREYKPLGRHRNSIILRMERATLNSTGLTGAKIEDSMNFITSLFNKLKKRVLENSDNLKSVLDSTMFEKIEEANKLKNSVNSDIIKQKKAAKNQIHLISIPKNNSAGIILNKLLNSEKLGQSGVLIYKIDSKKILEKIKQSTVISPYKIEAFTNEPEIKYFISKPQFRMKKFKIYSKILEDVPILNVKEFDWPEKGTFIEYQQNLFLYSGRVGFFFSKELVWNIDTSLEKINAIQVGNFPRREDYTLEYFYPKIYIFGGNSKEIQYFSLNDENDRRNLLNLPEEIGYSHSARIGDTVYLVGAKSKNLYKYLIKENKLETHNYQFFVNGQNKFVFDFNGNELIITNSQVAIKREIISQTGENFSGLRCSGKGKIVYSYLYFVTYNEKFESNVWRLCLISFQLVKL